MQWHIFCLNCQVLRRISFVRFVISRQRRPCRRFRPSHRYRSIFLLWIGKTRSNAVCVRDPHRFCWHRMSNPIPVWHRITHNLFQLNMNEFGIRIFTEIGHLMRSTHDFMFDIRFVSYHRSHQITSISPFIDRIACFLPIRFLFISKITFCIMISDDSVLPQRQFSSSLSLSFSDQQLCLFIFKQHRKWRSSCKSHTLTHISRSCSLHENEALTVRLLCSTSVFAAN